MLDKIELNFDFLKNQQAELEKKFKDLINKDKGNLENLELRLVLKEISKEVNQIKCKDYQTINLREKQTL